MSARKLIQEWMDDYLHAPFFDMSDVTKLRLPGHVPAKEPVEIEIHSYVDQDTMQMKIRIFAFVQKEHQGTLVYALNQKQLRLGLHEFRWALVTYTGEEPTIKIPYLDYRGKFNAEQVRYWLKEAFKLVTEEPSLNEDTEEDE